MPQKLETPLRRPTLHFQHLVEFQRLQPGMGKIERNGNGGHARWRKPFVPQIADRAKSEAARGNLLVKLRHAPFQFTAFNAHAKIANAPSQQFVFLQCHPGRFKRSLHRLIVKQIAGTVYSDTKNQVTVTSVPSRGNRESSSKVVRRVDNGDCHLVFCATGILACVDLKPNSSHPPATAVQYVNEPDFSATKSANTKWTAGQGGCRVGALDLRHLNRQDQQGDYYGEHPVAERFDSRCGHLANAEQTKVQLRSMHN
jgi:hypothetical protein